MGCYIYTELDIGRLCWMVVVCSVHGLNAIPKISIAWRTQSLGKRETGSFVRGYVRA
jgi:hypothetical protein